MVMAKEVATLDFYSGGRVLFGIGGGWLADETEIFGVDFRKRWPVTREYIAAMKRLWTEPQASSRENMSASRRSNHFRSRSRGRIPR